MELFHRIALEEYILAIQINKQDDSDYLKQKVYDVTREFASYKEPKKTRIYRVTGIKK